jgi:hemoglobin
MTTNARRAALAGLVAAILAISACAKPPEPEKSLYERVGGLGTITDVVDRFVDNMAADEAIKQRFASSNLSRLKIRIIQLICESTGGPCKYQGHPMAVAHKGMNITEEKFDASAVDFAKALDDAGVKAPEKEEILTLVASMEIQIVGK